MQTFSNVKMKLNWILVKAHFLRFLCLYFYRIYLQVFQNKYIDNTSKIYETWRRHGQIQTTSQFFILSKSARFYEINYNHFWLLKVPLFDEIRLENLDFYPLFIAFNLCKFIPNSYAAQLLAVSLTMFTKNQVQVVEPQGRTNLRTGMSKDAHSKKKLHSLALLISFCYLYFYDVSLFFLSFFQ